MDGVTDSPFRYMVAKYGKKDSRKQDSSEKSGVQVIFTEFVSVDALHHARGTKRWERVIQPLRYDESERPVVAQLFGKEPELFAEAAELVESLGFDGIDINMGCPARKVAERGAGAGLIRTPELAQEIVRVCKASTKLPVSVKTRVGVEDVSEMEEWIEALMEVKPAVISLHGRTLKQMYTGRADWEAIGRAGEIVHKHGRAARRAGRRASGMILGNGDINSMANAKLQIANYGVDGVLIGRASFGNPAIFAGVEPTKEQRLAWIQEHAHKHEEIFPDYFLPCRKHLAWYAKGFPGASELRQRLVRCSSAGEVERVVMEYSGENE